MSPSSLIITVLARVSNFNQQKQGQETQFNTSLPQMRPAVTTGVLFSYSLHRQAGRVRQAEHSEPPGPPSTQDFLFNPQLASNRLTCHLMLPHQAASLCCVLPRAHTEPRALGKLMAAHLNTEMK